MELLESKLEKHDLEISYMKKSLDELVEYSKETTKQLQKIGESIAKQEVILEKISNIEASHKESVKRLHDRVDLVEKSVVSEKGDVVDRLDLLESKLEKLRDNLDKRPCNAHFVVDNELKHVNEKLENHKKIFWTAISTVMVIVIGAIVKGALK